MARPKVRQTGGVGGYGAVWTLNSDQRTGRYGPHINVTRIVDYEDDKVAVKCLNCGSEWSHARGDVSYPSACRKAEIVENSAPTDEDTSKMDEFNRKLEEM